MKWIVVWLHWNLVLLIKLTKIIKIGYFLSSYSDNKVVIENYLIKPNYNIQNYKYKNKDYK